MNKRNGHKKKKSRIPHHQSNRSGTALRRIVISTFITTTSSTHTRAQSTKVFVWVSTRNDILLLFHTNEQVAREVPYRATVCRYGENAFMGLFDFISAV